ncbi:DNA replication ATP-dependent helicase/nuclease DNA2-like [Brevipalpus obovatus]|uniref:DNA replication ATP-dependent helicase/nuclease DNA2-like n=1 Tax=Brevipalpus obovatus TaxID=246614 RepID=UPI003D9EEE70
MENNVFNRFKVISVDKIDYEQLLEIQHVSSNRFFRCHLSGSWFRSKVFPGDIINVKSDKFDGKTYTIDDDHGLVTINPDNLLPVASITKSGSCLRREWLERLFKEIYRTLDESSSIGLIVRDIFRTACEERPETLEQLKMIRNKCLEKENIISKCSRVDWNEEMIRKVDEYLPCIMEWLEKYVLQDAGLLYDGKLSAKINTVKDIEENIWSPSLGVVGKVDVNCEVKIHNRKKRMPLAMKTGRAFLLYFSQQEDQSRLYSMMMRERGSEDCDGGLLLFLKNKKNEFEPVMNLIKVYHNEETELLQRRNELAYFLDQEKTDFSGPDFAQAERTCKNCTQRFNCSLMARSFKEEKIKKATKFRKKLIDSELKHLNSSEIEFFKEWMEILRNDWIKEKKELPFWAEPSSLREGKNLGFGCLKIRTISGKQVILTRACSAEKTLMSQPRLLGERVVISEDEPGNAVPTKVALFFGCVTEMKENEIEVTAERSIGDSGDYTKIYRLDIPDYGDLPFLHYQNLSTLMSKTMQSKWKVFHQLRDCIINGSQANSVDKLSLKVPEYDTEEVENRAIHLLYKMKAYLLLHGNSTSNGILSIVRALSKDRKSILITSPDPTILQRISFKLRSFGIEFVCFGMHSDCHPYIRKFTIESKIEKEKGNQKKLKLKEVYGKILVTVASCSAVSYDPLLLERNFDFSIILEANKIAPPAALSTLFISDRLILISNEIRVLWAAESGIQIDFSFGESLFGLLRKKKNRGISLTDLLDILDRKEDFGLVSCW